MTNAVSLDIAWSRIKRHEGEVFHTKTGKSFTYSIQGNALRPDCAKQNLAKREFGKALAKWPVSGPGRINNLVRGPAYIWAILHDSRILGTEGQCDDVPIASVAALMPVSQRPTGQLLPVTDARVAPSPPRTLRLESAYSSFAADLMPVSLQFEGGLRSNVFGAKNNKTLRETLEHARYSKLRLEAASRFEHELDSPLGQFMLSLKDSGDSFYLQFLNPYGDLAYCTFRISDSRFLGLKGIYAYTVGVELAYIGRCRDTMNQRVNQGYGRIHPKNCFLDGQATNCHLNAEIAKVKESVRLWMHPMDSVPDIEREERHLLRTYRPPWNKQLA